VTKTVIVVAGPILTDLSLLSIGQENIDITHEFCIGKANNDTLKAMEIVEITKACRRVYPGKTGGM
jgi:hypothetical protein